MIHISLRKPDIRNLIGPMGLRFLMCLLLISMLVAPSIVSGFFSPDDIQQRSKADNNFTSADSADNKGFTSSGLKSLQIDNLTENTDSWKRFLKEYGKDVQILGRYDNRGVYRIFGGNMRLSAPRGLISCDNMADACLEFIKENQDVFNLDTDEVVLLKSIHRGKISFVDFGQVYKGIPVYGSKISFIVTDTADVLSITLNHFPGIDIPELEAPEPEGAISLAKSDLEAVLPDIDFELCAKRLLVYPLIDNNYTSFIWAWALEFRSTEPVKKWQYIVAAEADVIINKKDLARYMITGVVKGQVLPRYAKDNPIEVSLPNLTVICLRNDPPLMYNSMDSDPGWLGTAPYGWEFGKPMYTMSGAGGPGPDKGHTGATFYGYNLNGCYPLNMWSPQYLTTLNPVNCLGKRNVYLKFWRWLGVEGSEADHASLEISDGPSSTWWKIWTNPEENLYDNGWRLILYDISKWADGRENIFFRWGMGPTNGYVSYCGWNIDDIGAYASISGTTDQTGNYKITGEAQKNILCSLLEGSFFKIINDDGANIIYTTNEISSGANNKDFNFTKTTNYDVSTKIGTINALSDIDEINTYYHANFLIKYIQEIDPDFLSDPSEIFPLNITIRYDREYNNSFWMPGEGIFFGEGDKLEYGNFAHFADIIYHECSHALTDEIYNNLDGTNTSFGETGYAALSRFTEFDAMHEAFSDYWACTITNDSKIAEEGFWIDHDFVRDINNDLNYLLNYGQELYQSSLILSGAMWDLRQALRKEIGDEGIRVSDTLFHFARLAQPTTYIDFLINCLIVDQVKYSSLYSSLIKETFGKRGISQAPPPPNSLIVTVENRGVSVIWKQSQDAIGYYLYYGQIRTTRPLTEKPFYMQDGGGNGDSSSGDGDMSGGGGMDGNGGSSSSSDQGSPSSSSSNNQNNTTSSNANTNVPNSKLDVGNTNSYYLTGLDPAVTYKVQITAYNIYGVESSPSEEALIPGLSSTSNSGTQTGDITAVDQQGLNWDVETGELGLSQGVTCFISSCEPLL